MELSWLFMKKQVIASIKIAYDYLLNHLYVSCVVRLIDIRHVAILIIFHLRRFAKIDDENDHSYNGKQQPQDVPTGAVCVV